MSTIERNGRTYQSATPTMEEVRFLKKEDLVAGAEFEGTYTGSFETTSQRYKKTQTVFKIKLASSGETVGLNGHGNLAALMKSVAVGSELLVIYKGKQKIKKGEWAGSLSHTYEVLQASVDAATGGPNYAAKGLVG